MLEWQLMPVSKLIILSYLGHEVVLGASEMLHFQYALAQTVLDVLAARDGARLLVCRLLTSHNSGDI